jgi:hypothetical protein
MKIDIDVRNEEEILKFIKAFGSEGRKAIVNELHKIAVDVKNDILKSMRSSPGGGRVYKSKGKVHAASLPGFPPKVDTGNLWNRIYVDKGYDYSEVYTNNVKYAKWLEKGTKKKDGTKKMEERPFFGPAIERSKWKRRIINRITAERFAGRRLKG